jgi:hypothetical protein
LVRKIQPDVYTASTKLNAWLGTDGIKGSSIRDKEPLCIKAGPPAAAAKVEELPNSKTETESSVESSDDKDATARTPSLPLC